MSHQDTLVVVTGCTGFIGGHCVLELLRRGYRVRGTLRRLDKADKVRATLSPHVEIGDRLEFAPLDLMKDDGWDEAMAGASYLLHVASPFPTTTPADPDELVKPAREGTLRALHAAKGAGVKRVVVTSSTAAIAYGHNDVNERTFDERTWTNPDGEDVTPYVLSKTLAEQAAWEFSEKTEGAPELATINPGLVLGPVLEEDYGTSGEVVRQLLARKMPACPRIGWALVDVRDVAWAHVEAMTQPEAAGQRFACVTGFLWLQEMALILEEEYGKRFKVPTRGMPGWLVRFLSRFNKPVRSVVNELDKHRDVSGQRLQDVLGWKPRSAKDAVLAMSESLIEHGVVTPRS